MNREKSCCFTGHRIIPKDDYYKVMLLLRQSVESKIKDGYTDFYTGGALGFDTLAALTVLRLKMVYRHIRLHLILPCKNQAEKWNSQDQHMYEKIINECDSVEYVSEEYTPYCMNQRNRALVDRSSFCIGYCTQITGGTAYTMGYALDNSVPVENIAQQVTTL